MDKKYFSESAYNEIFNEFSKGYMRSMIDLATYPVIIEDLKEDIAKLELNEDRTEEENNKLSVYKKELGNLESKVETIKIGIKHWEVMLDTALSFNK